jgi:esterase/lipase superfamily enzyme
MARKAAFLIVVAIFLLTAMHAARAAVNAPAVTALPTLALFGSPRPTYVLCPVAAETRAECLPTGNAAGGAAILAIRTAALRPGVERVVIFVPGFRTKFLDGRALAQHIADVLGPRFLVVAVDWGSHGSAAEYKGDATEAKRQTPALAALVTDLHRALPSREIGILAHSMGARLAAGAMATVPSPADGKPIVAETVLAAPDVALGDYQRAILRKPVPFGKVTIYVSRYDRALFLSSVVHLHERIGQLAVWRQPVANTTVVDASAAAPKVGGHGYAMHDAPVIRDIGAVFLDEPIPHPAWARSSGGIVWSLVPNRVANP